MTDFQTELDNAIAERDSLQAELGQALIEGKPAEAIRKKLRSALTAVDDAEAAQQAIAAASMRAARRAEEQASAAAAKAEAEMWKRAEADVNDLHATVAAKDRLLEKLKELNDREAHQARALVANYGKYMPGGVREEISRRGWNNQLVQRLRSDSGLWQWIKPPMETGVPGKAVAKCVPTFSRLFPGKVEKIKEAA